MLFSLSFRTKWRRVNRRCACICVPFEWGSVAVCVCLFFSARSFTEKNTINMEGNCTMAKAGTPPRSQRGGGGYSRGLSLMC